MLTKNKPNKENPEIFQNTKNYKSKDIATLNKKENTYKNNNISLLESKNIDNKIVHNNKFDTLNSNNNIVSKSLYLKDNIYKDLSFAKVSKFDVNLNKSDNYNSEITYIIKSKFFEEYTQQNKSEINVKEKIENMFSKKKREFLNNYDPDVNYQLFYRKLEEESISKVYSAFFFNNDFDNLSSSNVVYYLYNDTISKQKSITNSYTYLESNNKILLEKIKTFSNRIVLSDVSTFANKRYHIYGYIKNICCEFKFSDETLIMAIRLFDSFYTKILYNITLKYEDIFYSNELLKNKKQIEELNISLDNYVLNSLTCLFISSKYNERYPLNAKTLVKLAKVLKFDFIKEDILKKELNLINTIGPESIVYNCVIECIKLYFIDLEISNREEYCRLFGDSNTSAIKIFENKCCSTYYIMIGIYEFNFFKIHEKTLAIMIACYFTDYDVNNNNEDLNFIHSWINFIRIQAINNNNVCEAVLESLVGNVSAILKELK